MAADYVRTSVEAMRARIAQQRDAAHEASLRVFGTDMDQPKSKTLRELLNDIRVTQVLASQEAVTVQGPEMPPILPYPEKTRNSTPEKILL